MSGSMRGSMSWSVGGSMGGAVGGSRGGSMKGSMSVTPWVIRDTMCHPRCHSGDTMGYQRHHGLPETPRIAMCHDMCHIETPRIGVAWPPHLHGHVASGSDLCACHRVHDNPPRRHWHVGMVVGHTRWLGTFGYTWRPHTSTTLGAHICYTWLIMCVVRGHGLRVHVQPMSSKRRRPPKACC